MTRIIDTNCDYDAKINAFATRVASDVMHVNDIVMVLDAMRERGDADGANNFLDVALRSVCAVDDRTKFASDLEWNGVPSEEIDEIMDWLDDIDRS